MRGLDLVQADRSITARGLWLALLAVAIAACGPLPPEKREPRDGTRDGAPPYPETAPTRRYDDVDFSSFPRSAEEVSGPAVLGLLQQARSALSAGRPEQAVAALETALDIEPRNPFIWLQLAGTHVAQHQPDQAENKAQRANSFGRGNPYVEIESWRVIAAARQARGDLAGARAARARMEELQDLLD